MMFVVLNFVVALVVGVGLIWLALYGLDVYTRHGEVAVVPDLNGRPLQVVAGELAPMQLEYVVVDSMYDKTKALGAVLEQTPPAGSTVKRNSMVYLIVNSQTLRRVQVPELRDVSYRQAEAMLKSLGLVVGEIERSPSEYNDLVLDVRHDGESLLAGTELPEESVVSLVVGISTMANVPVVTPNLVGLTLKEAREVVLGAQMIVGATDYDVLPEGNDSLYVVYAQLPLANEWASAGESVDVQLTTDTIKTLVVDEYVEEEDFF